MSAVQTELNNLPAFKQEEHYLPTSHNRLEHTPNRGCKHCLREITEVVKVRATDESTFPLCPRCHRLCKKFGRDKFGRQRWYCSPCVRVFNDITVALTPKQEQMKEARERAIELLKQGYSLRVAARVVGISMNSIKDKPLFLSCGCGRISGHKGACYWRYQRSSLKARRDEAVAEMEGF